MNGLRPPRTADLTAFVRALLARRWIRFGMVGGAATLVYILLGLLFVNLWGMYVLVGHALAYALSFIASYLGQSMWTFRAARPVGGPPHWASVPHWSRILRFATVQALGLGLNSAIIWLLMRARLTYGAAMPIAVVSVPVTVYLLCKYWVFRQGAGAKPSTQAAPQAAQPVPPPTNEEKP